jgi:transposase-like protein
LVKHSGHSRATVQRILEYWLDHPPASNRKKIDARYLIFDGTFLYRRRGMYVVMDGVSHRVLYGAYGINEGPRDLLLFCRALKDQGLEPKSATMDGNPYIFRTVQQLWPKIIIQRCLVHVERQGLSWCRQHPKRTDAQHLRRIFLMVLHIHSQNERQEFQRRLDQWNNRYGQHLAHTPSRGWVMTDLQRAHSMIINALPYMFSYLDDEKIPRSTNALEGYFSRLKLRYRQHRGLSTRHRLNYFRWYFHLAPR